MTASIQIQDNGQTINIAFADILQYNGGLLPGGVAHAFQAMRAAFAALGEQPLQRREIQVRTAFGGAGGRDAVEYVTRAFSDGRAVQDPSIGTPDLFAQLPGPYAWHLSYQGRTAKATITEGWVRPEFIELGKKADKTPKDMERIVYLRQEMADRLLAAEPGAIYRVEVVDAVLAA